MRRYSIAASHSRTPLKKKRKSKIHSDVSALREGGGTKAFIGRPRASLPRSKHRKHRKHRNVQQQSRHYKKKAHERVNRWRELVHMAAARYRRARQLRQYVISGRRYILSAQCLSANLAGPCKTTTCRQTTTSTRRVRACRNHHPHSNRAPASQPNIKQQRHVISMTHVCCASRNVQALKRSWAQVFKFGEGNDWVARAA